MKLFEKFNIEKQVPILLISVLLIMLAVIMYRHHTLNLCNNIFIALPTHTAGGPKTGYDIYFTFKKRGVSYKSSDGVDKNNYERNGRDYYLKRRFFVKVSCSDNNNTEIVWDERVPDSLLTAPNDGWDTIPINTK